MEKDDMAVALGKHFQIQDYSYSAMGKTINEESLKIFRVENYWSIFILGHSGTPNGHLRNFEAAMQYLVEKRESNFIDHKLGMAINFIPMIEKQNNSYRKVLKKYSRSVVFTDLAIQLFIYLDGKIVQQIEPTEINAFLIHLDRKIADFNSD